MTKLFEYIAAAKLCEYTRPDKAYDTWSDTDFFHDSFYITITNPTQTQALLIMCANNSFVSAYFKRMAKDYIMRFKD